jgi:hypothetical protein
VVTEVDGTRLRNAGELSRALNRRDEGDVTLTIMRDRKTRTIKVTPDRTQNNPTLFTPRGMGTTMIAPMALTAPRISTVPMRAVPAMPARPAMPSLAPRLAPFATPRPSLAPRIYVTPATPARSGVWIL